MHVGGASHGGRMFVENVRGHLRWFAKHRGPRRGERARAAARAWRCGCADWSSAASAAGCTATPPARSDAAHPVGAARAAGARDLPALPDTGWGLWVRLAAATACLLLPGALLARALRRADCFSAVLAWSLGAIFVAMALVFLVHASLTLALSCSP